MSDVEKKDQLAEYEEIKPEERRPAWRPQDADREIFRYETKRRIQQYSVPPQTIFRPAKPTPTIRDEEHKRVAVYARVSTKSREQVSSIENQTRYYIDTSLKAIHNPNWTLTEIYSDEGKSGTSKKWRKDFKRMLDDAAKKKMDLIVCASVSRFARNISDLIEEVRKLRTTNPSNPVGVYFETEDLYTLDPNINERLQMQGLFALIDEIDLVLDSVLERMNSIFEADSVLVISEKNINDNVEIIKPYQNYAIISTICLKGNEAKKELSQIDLIKFFFNEILTKILLFQFF